VRSARVHQLPLEVLVARQNRWRSAIAPQRQALTATMRAAAHADHHAVRGCDITDHDHRLVTGRPHAVHRVVADREGPGRIRMALVGQPEWRWAPRSAERRRSPGTAPAGRRDPRPSPRRRRRRMTQRRVPRASSIGHRRTGVCVNADIDVPWSAVAFIDRSIQRVEINAGPTQIAEDRMSPVPGRHLAHGPGSGTRSRTQVSGGGLSEDERRALKRLHRRPGPLPDSALSPLSPLLVLRHDRQSS
jgi:hypothetical protein